MQKVISWYYMKQKFEPTMIGKNGMLCFFAQHVVAVIEIGRVSEWLSSFFDGTSAQIRPFSEIGKTVPQFALSNSVYTVYLDADRKHLYVTNNELTDHQ